MKSTNARAASAFCVVLRIATGSVTAGRPSVGNTKSIGEPLALALNAMKSTSTPYVFSPLATAVSTAPLPRTAMASSALSFSK